MSTAALVQAIVIGLAGLWAAWFAFRRLLPRTYRRWLALFAARVDQPGVPRALRALARHVEPRSPHATSCGEGCGSCGGCDAKAGADIQPIRLRPPAARHGSD